MALTALGTAAEPFLGHFESGWDVVLVVESPRPGLDEAAVMGVRSAAQTLFAGKRAKISLEYGAAGCQRALISLAARLNAGESKVGCLLAVDSFMSVLALADDHRPPVVWRPQENPLSEAAAALVVTADVGIPQGLVPVGRILHNAVRYGIPSDLNDEIVDGHALTRILHAIPDMGRPIPAVFGPTGVDPLRLREWLCASVRIARRLCEPYASHDLESQIGRIGAASGLAHLVYGLTCLRHRVAHPELNKGVLALGWTISRDGQRGVTLFEGGVP